MSTPTMRCAICERVEIIVADREQVSRDALAFVLAAASLRARNYAISAPTSLDVQRVVGNLAPSIVTATAAGAALACVELLKCVGSSARRRRRELFAVSRVDLVRSTPATCCDRTVSERTGDREQRASSADAQRDSQRPDVVVVGCVRRARPAHCAAAARLLRTAAPDRRVNDLVRQIAALRYVWQGWCVCVGRLVCVSCERAHTAADRRKQVIDDVYKQIVQRPLPAIIVLEVCCWRIVCLIPCR
jgi:hypothetical protein